MPALEDFTMPDGISLEEETATETYAKIITEPWEKGFGHTLGNALRRVLLSSLEGVAVSSIRIDGVSHEFSSLDDVIEDVTEIILNIKNLKLQCDGELPRTLELRAQKAGDVTAANINEDGVTTVLNPDLHICTLDKDRDLRMEIEIDKARGYRPAEMNKKPDQPIGVIPVDCMASPVQRARYEIHSCRVGQRTDLDRMEMEVWTDGRLDPQEAFYQAARILSDHVSVLATGQHPQANGNAPAISQNLTSEQEESLKRLLTPLDDIELSVRGKNCLKNAGIQVVGQLVEKNRSELLKLRNFGKKSLEEIRARLSELDLQLGMDLSEEVRQAMHEQLENKS